jgi:hypothetical protein
LSVVSTGRLRPLVQREDHQLIFMAIHSVAHPGIRATLWSLAWVEDGHRLLVPGYRDTRFSSDSWSAFCDELMGVRHIMTMAYGLQS